LSEVIAGLNALGVASRDMIDISQSSKLKAQSSKLKAQSSKLKAAGALHAGFIVN